jgi:hypothetical protein
LLPEFEKLIIINSKNGKINRNNCTVGICGMPRKIKRKKGRLGVARGHWGGLATPLPQFLFFIFLKK